eukprot:NODE_952_length_1746_cov_226.175417_g892_i0.p1 GENE.NODE_952_length_1746_cov_226.175417_g892_i0~~NODE_952_length_1746_cov_226.175417_g892_i0.p1  ORF type:complete len:529 (+),score=93.77 NODE_952_length_1746_cov_226.175417_g892_i0:58-1644(+)
MEQQHVVEPYEEVGYKIRPPLLEDVSIEGPLRTPIPHSLDTLEQRERIEEDYNWWRYSPIAFPTLVLILLLLVALFALTAFQQVGDIRSLRSGIPTYFQLHEVSSSSDEAGIPKVVRSLRISACSIAIFAVVFAFLVLLAKPRPKLRKLLIWLTVFLLFVAMVVAWVAFGIGEDDPPDSVRCPEMVAFTNEKCDSTLGIARAANVLDFLLAASALTALITLAYTNAKGDFKLNRTGWRQQERDAEQEKPKKSKFGTKPHHGRRTRVLFTSAALIITLLFAIALIAFVIVLHQNHEVVNLRNMRGRTDETFDSNSTNSFYEAGWSARNTRLRYGFTGIGILAVLLNLFPFRSRVVAYLFAFFYFVVAVLAIVCFALDVDELKDARDIFPGCEINRFRSLPGDSLFGVENLSSRSELNCVNGQYVATAVLELIVAIICLIYLLNEFVVRYRSIHSGRKYPWYQIRKVEQELDSRRPVRCEITSEVMTAAEYYYRHRFLTENEMMAAAVHELSPRAQYGLPYDTVPQHPYA